MRDTVQDMAQRMAVRDEAVAAELHSFQHEQLAKQQRQLSDAHAAAQAATAAADTLRDALLTVHTALSPHSLASVLGPGDRAQTGFSLRPEGYEELTSRLLQSAQAVTAADGEAVAARVRELLAQVRGCYIHWWRRRERAGPAAVQASSVALHSVAPFLALVSPDPQCTGEL